ncbi:MAG: hypothetical protein HQ541_14945 [Mariniphaga sp.]|nr:hypothetical protein [Mariniphaga sp.]
MKSKIRYLFLVILAIALFTSCEEEIDFENMDVKERVYSVMKHWYYWDKEIPDDIDLSQYSSGKDLMDDLKYSEIDRWSYVGDASDYDQYYNQGLYSGFGYGIKFDQNSDLRISFVYTESPMYKTGARRGWKFITEPIIESGERKFQMLNLNNDTVKFSAIPATVVINTVLHKEVISEGGKEIGYLVFKNFLETSEVELEEAFTLFENNNISELIVDLRYNGGGRVRLAGFLGGKILPQNISEIPFVSYTYNKKQARNNSTWSINKTGNLNLKRVIIITSKSTASASELLINGLKPYMDVVLIGEDATYGKPVGSFGIVQNGYVISAISFKVSNANSIGNYFDGFNPDVYRNDGLDKPFGDRE